MHGLIQAYSRTNRILNSVKTFGNIVCFRDLQKATEDALALFEVSPDELRDVDTPMALAALRDTLA